jgi:hypothetical protein
MGKLITFVIAATVSLSLGYTPPVQAQSAQQDKARGLPEEIKHTPEQLKVFEGFYQESRDAGTLMQITEKGNELIVKRHWTGDEFKAVPDSPLHFFCRSNLAYTLQFIKGDDGAIVGLLAFGDDPFDKVKKPSLTPGQLSAFVGKYRDKDDPDNLIHISAKDSGLVVTQLWDGKEIPVQPLAGFFFNSSDRTYSLYFKKDHTGAIAGVQVMGKKLFERVNN